jgi:hypothetical protein
VETAVVTKVETAVVTKVETAVVTKKQPVQQPIQQPMPQLQMLTEHRRIVTDEDNREVV